MTSYDVYLYIGCAMYDYLKDGGIRAVNIALKLNDFHALHSQTLLTGPKAK